MANFARTRVPVAMQVRLDARKAKQDAFANLMVARGLRPPDPGGGAGGAAAAAAPNRFNPLRAAIHGLKQCVHCGRFWNRDLNAARNIGWVFLGTWLDGRRPVHLLAPENEKNKKSNFSSSPPTTQNKQTKSDRALALLIAVPSPVSQMAGLRPTW